jgi:hypothetical protein
MKFVVDIDNTICTSSSSYKESVPIFDRISKINDLYDQGNTIVYFTARGMNSFKGIKIFVFIKYFFMTKKQLKSWGAKYNKLIIGKPSADFYIDDKSISDKDFFNGEKWKN